jgi:hypothetical protein
VGIASLVHPKSALSCEVVGDPKSEDTMVKVRRDEQRIKARMWLAARMAPRKMG